MAGVKNINEGRGASWENILAAANKKHEEVKKGENQEGLPSKDRVEFSGEWNEMEWPDAVQKALDDLKKQNPSLHIVIDEGNNSDNLSALAAGLGKGTHLVLSRKFLERMGSGADEFAKCSSVLSGVVKQLQSMKEGILASGAYIGENQAKTWSAEKKQEEKPKEEKNNWLFAGLSDGTQKNKKEDLFKIKVSSSFGVSRHYSKLAGARSKGQVRTVLADVQRSIGNLQMTAVYGDDEERIKASRALRSLKKLLTRGGRKISRINREELVSLRKKKAEKRNEERKAEAARLELKKRQAARAGADNSLVKEGRGDEAYIRGYRHYRRLKEYDLERQIPIETLPPELPGAIEGGMGGMEAGFTAADVTVSEPISF